MAVAGHRRLSICKIQQLRGQNNSWNNTLCLGNPRARKLTWQIKIMESVYAFITHACLLHDIGWRWKQQIWAKYGKWYLKQNSQTRLEFPDVPVFQDSPGLMLLRHLFVLVFVFFPFKWKDFAFEYPMISGWQNCCAHFKATTIQ